MKIVKTILFALILCVGITGCSKQENIEPEEMYSFDEIIGKWTVTSYLSSDGYFVSLNNGEFYQFQKNNTCLYYSGNTLQTNENYEFGYSEPNKRIILKHSKGWDLNIDVEFKNSNEATFYITGKTSNSNQTVKMKRN